MKTINAITHANGAGFTLQFLNGNVEIPDIPGAYSIAAGCGSGKTTCIRSIIQQKAAEGILYCVDTLDALENMYRGILCDIHEGRINGITTDDILCIRGNRTEKDGQDDNFNKQLKEYKDRPQELVRKKIILLTHARFFSELVQYFLVFSDDPIVIGGLACFNGDFGRLMTSLPIRRYIIFDETPNFWTPLVRVPKLLMYGLTKDERDEDGRRLFHDNLLEQYDKLCSGSCVNPLGNGTEFKKQKKYTVLSMLKNTWKDWETDTKMDHAVYFYPKDLIQPGMKSYVLLFEGAADVLLKGSRFSLIDIPEKYNAKVEFHKFQFDCRRKDKHENTADKYADDAFNIMKDLTGQTLVFCWKNVSGEAKESPGVSKFRDEIEQKLLEMGMPTTNFSVIYYGSSQCKSTNQFRTYRNIIFLGNWNIADGDLALTKEAYRTNLLDLDRWKFYFYVQMIARIGIRNHMGGEYDVYFSSDFEDGFINGLKSYFNENTEYKKPDRVVDLFEKKLKLLDDSRFRSYARSLAGYDAELKEAIVKGVGYELLIPFEVLVKVCPRESKKARPWMYKAFATSLFNAMGIKISTSNRRGVISRLYN